MRNVPFSASLPETCIIFATEYIIIEPTRKPSSRDGISCIPPFTKQIEVQEKVVRNATMPCNVKSLSVPNSAPAPVSPSATPSMSRSKSSTETPPPPSTAKSPSIQSPEVSDGFASTPCSPNPITIITVWTTSNRVDGIAIIYSTFNIPDNPSHHSYILPLLSRKFYLP